MKCGLCGHGSVMLGAGVAEPGRPYVDLCHGCEEDHDCYRRWTVYGERPGGVRVQREEPVVDLLSPWLFGEVGK